MAEYIVGGRSAATAATARHVAANVWNPHASDRIRIKEIWVCITTAGVANIGVARTTTRGTPGSTVTPDIDNDTVRGAAPNSGFLLDLAAFTAQPTVDGSDLLRWNLPAAIGAAVIFSFREKPTEVPAGTGLAVITATAVVFPASDFTFVVED
jgi:hypothetical protein